MRFSTRANFAVALAGLAVGQGSSSTPYCDDETSICYSSYTNEVGVTFRVALPEQSEFADAIYQVVVPKSLDLGWVGFSWAGRMTLSPLTVAWLNGDQPTASSRYATTYFGVPRPYDDGEELIYLKGTYSNATHWSLNVRCLGCTRWDSGNGPEGIDGLDETVFAFAISYAPVYDPATNTSSFDIHDVYGHWTHDLRSAKSPKYLDWVNINTPGAQNLTRRFTPGPRRRQF